MTYAQLYGGPGDGYNLVIEDDDDDDPLLQFGYHAVSGIAWYLRTDRDKFRYMRTEAKNERA